MPEKQYPARLIALLDEQRILYNTEDLMQLSSIRSKCKLHDDLLTHVLERCHGRGAQYVISMLRQYVQNGCTTLADLHNPPEVKQRKVWDNKYLTMKKER